MTFHNIDKGASNSEIVDTIDQRFGQLLGDADKGQFLYIPTVPGATLLQRYFQEKIVRGLGERNIYINLRGIQANKIAGAVGNNIRRLLRLPEEYTGIDSMLKEGGVITGKKGDPGTLLIDGALPWLVSSEAHDENWELKAARDSNITLHGFDFRIIMTIEDPVIAKRFIDREDHAFYGSVPSNIYIPEAIKSLEAERKVLLKKLFDSFTPSMHNTLIRLSEGKAPYINNPDPSDTQHTMNRLRQSPIPFLYKAGRGEYYIPEYVREMLKESNI